MTFMQWAGLRPATAAVMAWLSIIGVTAIVHLGFEFWHMYRYARERKAKRKEQV